MSRYVGFDVHKRFIEVCILDEQGKVLFRGRADCDRKALKSLNVPSSGCCSCSR